MTGAQTLALRAALGGASAGASLLLVASRPLFRLRSRTFDRLAAAALPVSRLLLFALIFLVLHISARGDIPSYYLPEGLAALHGALPYRDFPSSYGPLHPYLDAAILRLWPASPALILFSILVEALAFPVSLALGRRLFADRPVRVAALLWLSSPISLQFVTIDGQDNILLALLLGLALLASLRLRDTLSGLCTGLGASLLKVLALFYAPVFFLARTRRLRWAAGFLAALLLGFGIFLALRLPLLLPLQIESGMKQSGDLPFLLESISGLDLPGRVLDLIMLAGVALVYLLTAVASRRAGELSRARTILFALPAVTLAIELLAKKSWPPYLVIVLFPLALLVSTRGWLALVSFELFSFVAVTEHSVWASLLGSATSAQMHAALQAHQRGAWLYLAALTLLLAGYAWLLLLSLSAMRDREFAVAETAPVVAGRAV